MLYSGAKGTMTPNLNVSHHVSTLSRLQTWYAQQCNGEWEHSSGISIDSCDNPGWWVKVSILGTSLQTHSFTEVAEGVDAQRFALGSSWLSCHVDSGMWHGAGDETKLERILETFLDWAEESGGAQETPPR